MTPKQGLGGGNREQAAKDFMMSAKQISFFFLLIPFALIPFYLLSARSHKLPLADGSFSQGRTQMRCAVFSHQQKCQVS